jgi:hypothetical protein
MAVAGLGVGPASRGAVKPDAMQLECKLRSNHEEKVT